jgi:hypothetical protein
MIFEIESLIGNYSADIIMAQGDIPKKMPETWIAFDT